MTECHHSLMKQDIITPEGTKLTFCDFLTCPNYGKIINQ